MTHTPKKYSVITLLIGIFALGIFAYIAIQFKPVIESKKTDLAKIPKSIKRSLRHASPSATLRVPILLYHYIEHVKDKNDTIRQSLNIPPDVFDQQVKTLSDAGYTFITASELADILDDKAELPAKPILLSFDDGHWDLYTQVLPVLEKYHVKATAYIVSGFIGGSDFLSQDQLRGVIQSGLVEIGAHTVHHIALAHKLLPITQYEIGTSKKQLEDTYHLHVVSFAYPGGSFDQQAIDTVKNAGFRTAVSTVPGIDQRQANRFLLYRIRPGYRTGNELLKYLQQDSFRPW